MASAYHQRISDAEALANAEFIVRACNSHAELVETLAEVLGVLDDGDLDTAIGLGLDSWVMRARAELEEARGES